MQQEFGWQPTRTQKWTVGIGVSLAVLFGVLGYLVEPISNDTGFGETIYTKESTDFDANGSVIKTTRTEDPRRAKTLWDWLQLLIVPAVLAIGGILFNWQQNRRAQSNETQRAQDTALQAYLDQISELLIDKSIRKEWRRYGDKRVTARARTLAVLSQLDGNRKQIVLRFLREARLINTEERVLEGRTIYPCYVGLKDADLTHADLRNIKLEEADLEGANLENANLTNANLRGANLQGVNLRGAILKDTDLRTFFPEDGDTTKLLPTNLRAEGLTRRQLKKARGDDRTQLPENCPRPTSWSASADERANRE